MQKRSLIRLGVTLTLAATALFTTQLPLQAADNSAKSTKAAKAKKTKASSVSAVIKKLKLTAYNENKDKFASAKPNTKAKFYIYMQSASYCGPCCAKMPSVVEAYKEMQEDGRVEIILVNFDADDNAMQGFLKRFKAEFPTISYRDVYGVSALPGYEQAKGLPHMRIVDAKGKIVVENFHNINDWKAETIEKN